MGAWTPRNDARPWIGFCLTAHYRQAQILFRRTDEINRLWDELEALVNGIGLPDRTIFALAGGSLREPGERGFESARREGLLVADGQTRGRAYVASDAIKTVRSRTREPKKVLDPVY